MLRVAFLTSDGRELRKDYGLKHPEIAYAPLAVLQGLSKIPDVEVHVISCLRQEVESPEKLADNIWFHGLVVPQIGWMRTSYLGCIRAVRRKLREIQPDLVHGQGTEKDCAISAVMSGYPNVITLHGIMREMVSILGSRPGSFHWLASLLESFSLRRTAGVFCNSRFTEAKARPRTRQTFLIPNPVREEYFQQPSLRAKPAKPVLLNVGTVCTYKRQNELLDIAEQLRAEGLEFELHFLGSASRANAYGTKFLDRVQNSPHFIYQGLKLGDELIAQYDGASALVHVSAVETFGLVVAEALARNLKFFGFKVGGVPDIAQGVDGAELVADGDWIGLKNALRAWIQAGAPRPVSASVAMRNKYHPEVIARRHLEIYREVLNTRS